MISHYTYSQQRPCDSYKTHEEANPIDNLESIRQYIDNNVQSQRRDILTLYSHTITHPGETQIKGVDDLGFSISLRDRIRRPRILGPIQKRTNEKSLQPENSHEIDDSHMIISNKFAKKQRKQKSLLTRTKKHHFQASKTKYTAQTSSQSPAKPPSPKYRQPIRPKLPVPELPTIRLKTKKIKSHKKQHIASEINPWEYLIVPDHPQSDYLQDRQLPG